MEYLDFLGHRTVEKRVMLLILIALYIYGTLGKEEVKEYIYGMLNENFEIGASAVEQGIRCLSYPHNPRADRSSIP